MGSWTRASRGELLIVSGLPGGPGRPRPRPSPRPQGPWAVGNTGPTPSRPQVQTRPGPGAGPGAGSTSGRGALCHTRQRYLWGVKYTLRECQKDYKLAAAALKVWIADETITVEKCKRDGLHAHPPPPTFNGNIQTCVIYGSGGGTGTPKIARTSNIS